MKNKKPGKKLLFLVPLIILTIAIIIFIPMKEALVFQYQNTGNVLAYIPFSAEDHFKIKYTHSIHLSDVVESYVITEDDEIKQYELMYEDFAIGMPENASDGEIFEQKNGKYYIKNMNRVFPYFDLRTGKVRANHTIIYRKKEYPLSDYIEPGTWVRIKTEKVNLLQQLRGVNILEQS
ncbi:DUF1850 domain-containing protein [Cytobacillus praedii]|uniref:DUF1850 domain-containing protein n=1 Tax=Cytobacillus praedii TaxID=1742358 RepID=UPI002E1F7E76|nr:DUF1850 domain-containing protein [Cytobacillus praedii]